MSDIILAVLFSVAIANILKASGARNILTVFWGNYLFAFIFSVFLVYNSDIGVTSSTFSSLPDILAGFLTGFMFLMNFIIYTGNIRKNGMAMSVSIMRISMIVPVMISFFFFGESVGPFKMIAFIIILVSFYMLGRRDSISSILWLGILFIFTGMTDTCFKFYQEKIHGNSNVFLAYTFASAFLINTLFIIVRKVKIDFKSLVTGIVLGIPNQLTSLFFLRALKDLDAIIAYPLFACSVVLFSVFSDMFIWKQKFGTAEKICFGAIILGIALLNI